MLLRPVLRIRNRKLLIMDEQCDLRKQRLPMDNRQMGWMVRRKRRPMLEIQFKPSKLHNPIKLLQMEQRNRRCLVRTRLVQSRNMHGHRKNSLQSSLCLGMQLDSRHVVRRPRKQHRLVQKLRWMVRLRILQAKELLAIHIRLNRMQQPYRVQLVDRHIHVTALRSELERKLRAI